MARQSIAFKVSEETRERLEVARGDMDGESFASTLLDAFERSQTAAGIEVSSRARPEVKTLGQTLQKALDSMTSIVELSEQERETAKKEVEDLKEAKDKEIVFLKGNLSSQTEYSESLAKQLQERDEEIKSLKQSQENIVCFRQTCVSRKNFTAAAGVGFLWRVSSGAGQFSVITTQ